MKKYATILAILVSLSTIAGIGLTLDNRFAKAESVNQLRSEFKLFVLRQRMKALQERLWHLEDRYPETMPVTVKEEYRRLKQELSCVLKELGIK